MSEGPDIARVAALVADPARSAMLIALMDGRALTATELAGAGGITKQTASSHLAKLVDGEVLTVEAQGRHRYFRLAGSHVAGLLEALMVFSSDIAPPLRSGPSDPALRKARICYDHLAGEMGVRLFDRMVEDRWLDADLTLTDHGREKLETIDLNVSDLPKSNRLFAVPVWTGATAGIIWRDGSVKLCWIGSLLCPGRGGCRVHGSSVSAPKANGVSMHGWNDRWCSGHRLGVFCALFGLTIFNC